MRTPAHAYAHAHTHAHTHAHAHDKELYTLYIKKIGECIWEIVEIKNKYIGDVYINNEDTDTDTL
jgi:hypothetical protein